MLAKPVAGLLLVCLGILPASAATFAGASVLDRFPESSDSSSTGPKNAPVTIVEFSDFECPFSKKAAPVIQELLRANPGKIRLRFRHNPLPFHLHSGLAHEAAVAAGAQGRFWEMHDLLFAHQDKLSESDLLQYARQLQLDIGEFQNALQSHAYRGAVDADAEEARGLGVTGTPTFFINGRKFVGVQTADALQAALDQALGLSAGSNPGGIGPVPPSAPQLSGPIEKVDAGDSAARGDRDGAVTVVEFSDFQCPFCARAVPTLQELLRQYPQGVRWVFKNFPLEFHPDSLLAHRAALAAGEQGKFWEMHDLIFANQGAIKHDDLVHNATVLGLDINRFLADLASDKVQKVIQADKTQGDRLGVTGTPTFFVNGKRMVGAWPLADYKRLVEAELSGGKHRPATAALTPPAARPAVKTDRPASAPAKYAFSVKGPESAPVTITWYADLESPLTPLASQVVSQLWSSYPEKIRLLFKNLPMGFHPHAAFAHQAMLAAGAQGKFWQMQELILARQNKLTKDDLLAHARTLGLDLGKFNAALEGRLYQPVLDADAADAQQQGVYGVPVFFINAKRIDGVQPLATLKEIIEAELARAQTATTGQ